VKETNVSDQFEPRLIGFLCRWCSYNGADLAGTSRMKYPPNLVPIKTNCSGRVDPTHIMKALSEGADGVLIAGCHIGDCHYINGNWRTVGRYPMMKKMLEQLGLEEGRVRLEWVSAAEGEKFQRVVTEFTEEIRALGPLGWGNQFRDEAAEAVTAEASAAPVEKEAVPA
jgi:F420-non-reducing hydrogenase iron-sulfur subunit